MKKIGLTLKLVVVGLAMMSLTSTGASSVPPPDLDTTRTPQEIETLANQGNAAAAYQLGLMYAKGAGMPQNNLMAYQYMSKAAAGGNVDAMHWLGAHHRVDSPQ